MSTPPYKLAHARVKSRYGAARNWSCTFCGLSGEHWALDHDAREIERDDKGRAYSPNPDAYVPLCTRCHRAYDRHVVRHGTAGVVELIDQMRSAVPEAIRDTRRQGIISSINSLMRMGYLRPGRERQFRR